MLLFQPCHYAFPGWGWSGILWVESSPSVGMGLSKRRGILPGHGQTEGRVTGSIYAVNPPVCSPVLLCPALGDLMIVNSITTGFEQHTLAHIFAVVLHAVYFDSFFSSFKTTVCTPLVSNVVSFHEVLDLIFCLRCHPPPLLDFIGPRG